MAVLPTMLLFGAHPILFLGGFSSPSSHNCLIRQEDHLGTEGYNFLIKIRRVSSDRVFLPTLIVLFF